MTATNLAALKAGQIVWTRGTQPYGDDATGGAFIQRYHDPETGESMALILTYQAATPRQGTLHLLDRRGGNRDLGLIARLIRVPMSEVRPPQDDLRDWRTVLLYANKAGQAAFIPPNNGIDSTTHGALLDAARLLHREAIELYRGKP